MGRTSSCCSNGGLHKGPWTAREDALLVNYIQQHGEGHWRALPKKAGLLRCGKSCRLRWMNYLRPDIKRGNITADEDDLIIKLHSLLGNRWSLIAGRLPGRTDNEIKNYWNSHLSKRLAMTTTQNSGHQAKEEKIMTITSNSANGETSSSNTTTKPTRVLTPLCDKENFGVGGGDDGGGAEAESAVEAGGEEKRENGDVFGGCEILYGGISWNCSGNGKMNIDEVDQDDSYQQLLNLQGQDYIQLDSFIDYFLI